VGLEFVGLRGSFGKFRAESGEEGWPPGLRP